MAFYSRSVVRGKLFLRGNYGYGNYGDDVLLWIMLKVLCERYSPESIIVEVGEPRIYRPLFPGVCFLNVGEAKKIVVDTLVFGGGGQFFSFKESDGSPERIRRRLGRALRGDFTFSDALEYIKRSFAFDRATVISRRSFAFCVGVGPFEGEGKEVGFTKSMLSSCKRVVVRDAESDRICKEWGLKDVIFATDLSFLSDYWLDASAIVPTNLSRSYGTVAFVFRGWPFHNYANLYSSRVIPAINALEAAGVSVRPVSLSLTADSELIGKLGRPVEVWDPASGSISDFLSGICDGCDLIISARAHGILLPAIAGVPGICVDVEPKLRNVHLLLPHSTEIWSPPYGFPDLLSIVSKITGSLQDYKRQLTDDVEDNKRRADLALIALLEFLDA